MTEQEWLTSEDPAKMLNWITVGYPFDRPENYFYAPKPSDRKLRLLACAVAHPYGGSDPETAKRWYDEIERGYANFPGGARKAARNGLGHMQANHCDPRIAAALLRCIFGNPFRPPCMWVNEPPPKSRLKERRTWLLRNWLVWQGAAAPKLARAIYDARDWASLPVLADALEEARCQPEEECPVCKGEGYYDPSRLTYKTRVDVACKSCGGTGWVPNPLLAHLRGPSPHCRGCWVLDLILGLE